MKEHELIGIIKGELNSKYIGDDCAYIKDSGIVVTQDNLVEDVHFCLEYISPFELGYKSVMVNLSDIAASGAEPLCLTVGLSLPKYVTTEFIKDFYRGMKKAAGKIQIVGGDITGGDKVFISVTAIGKDSDRKISSRKFAKSGQKILVSGNHGSSAAGLELLKSGISDRNSPFIKAHLMPMARLDISKNIAKTANKNYAMMDTSDGLADALSAIADASGVKMVINFDKIPKCKNIEQFENYKDLVLYGGEDYELVATLDFIPEGMTVIGEVMKGQGLEIIYDDYKEILTRKDIERKLYNHFEGNEK